MVAEHGLYGNPTPEEAIRALRRLLDSVRASLAKCKAECDSLRAELERRGELHIVFDGPPSHESGRFVEVETPDGHSVDAGRWEQRGDYWHLILTKDSFKAEPLGEAANPQPLVQTQDTGGAEDG